ncbi:MAG: hypothetical protein IH840_04250 [Candidatus Heimdallarchaeota archaeon]|nr:hypothetical protein [Candidatus Heimdallarchaeota archaeon]
MSVQSSPGTDVTEMDDQFIGSLFVGIIFLAVTGFTLNFVTSNTTIFDDAGFSNALVQILLGIAFIMVVAIFANYKALDFLQDHAVAILIWSYRLMIGFFIGVIFLIGVLLLPSIVGIILLIVGAGIIFLVFRFWERLERRLRIAGEWISISATVVLNEPGMIVISFIQSLIVGIAAITEILAWYAWLNFAEAEGVSGGVSDGVVYGILFLYLWLTLSILYYFDGANTFIAYVRLKGYDPKVGQGINAATKKIPSIIMYALISAIVTVIVFLLSQAGRAQMREGRQTNNPGAVALGIFLSIVASIAATLYHFVSFFTLPSIIIRQNTTFEAMSESSALFQRLFWDVIITDTGYSIASRVMYIFSGLVLGIVGFAYGYIVASPAAGTEDPVFWGILVGVLSLIVGLLITKFFLRPLYTTIVTTTYVYATEGPEVLANISDKLIAHMQEVEASPRARRGPSSRRVRF